GVTKLDKVKVYRLKQHMLTIQGGLKEGVDVDRAAFAVFGIELPIHPSWEEVLAEKRHMDDLLGNRPIEAIADLPRITDPEIEALLQIMPTSIYVDRNLYFVSLARMVALTLEYGVGDTLLHFVTY